LVTCLSGARAALQLSGDSVVYDSVSGAVRGEVFVAVQGVVRDLMCSDVHTAVHDAVYDGATRALEDALRGAVGGTVHGEAHRAVHGVMRRAVRVEVSNITRCAMGDAVQLAVRDAVHHGLHSASGVTVADLWWRYLGAQVSVGIWWWGPAAVSYALDVLRLDIGRDMELRARAYAALCESCCLVWPHRDFAILCERPRTLEVSGPGETVEEMRRQRLVRAAWDGWEVVS
jgi:hypothetical protein